MNTSILYRIFALHYAQLAKNKTKGTEWRFPESSRGMSQRVNFFCVPNCSALCRTETSRQHAGLGDQHDRAPFGLSVRNQPFVD